MRAIQTGSLAPLSSVKPLDGLQAYRAFCLEAARRALHGAAARTRCPADGASLEPCGAVDGVAYSRCASGGGLFLSSLPDADAWAGVLASAARQRHAPKAFHAGLAQSRADHVYAPKLAWIQDTLRLQELARPALLEVTTPPSDFTALLRESRALARVETADETAAASGVTGPAVQTAVLLESLDRSADPAALLRGVRARLAPGGLLFVTSLVASGFDLAVLGLRNAYLYPPDRTNCFSLRELSGMIERAGFALVEVSTPGVLDVEIVLNHVRAAPALPLSAFERELLAGDEPARQNLQTFLQQQGLSSFARIVARREG